MKPRLVSMCAFGPYPKTQIVDFRELKHHPLFLITGPTGSGKTTVLDAMCFALFGVATGADRTGEGLRSDHATIEDATSVVFDFELGNKRYRVARSPKQDRPKKRGSGTTSAEAKAVLWKNGLTAADDEDGEVVAEGSSKVNAAVETLLGFKAEQFRQVVMIPQGEFRKLLSVSVGDREKILRALFRTEHFLRVAEALKKRHAAVRKRLEKGNVQRDTLFKNAGVESADELGGLITAGEKTITLIVGEVGKLEAAAKKAGEAHEAGVQASKTLAELKDAQQKASDLAKEIKTVEAQRSELGRANKAATIRAKSEFRQLRAGELADATTAASEATEVLATATVAAKSAEAALKTEKKRDPQRAGAQQGIGELQTHRGKADKLAGAQEASELAEGALTAAKTDETASAEALEQQKAAAELARAALDTARTTAATAPGARTASEAAKKLCAEAAAHLEKARESQSADHQHTEGLAGQIQAEQLVGSTRATLKSVRAAWTRGQAVVLARDLEDGGACPVCGSTDHPAPASGDEDVPEQKAIDSAETSVRQAEANLERIAKAVAEAKASAAASRAAVKTLRQGLGDAADTPLDDLQERAEEAARVFELADAAARALPGLKKASEVAGAGAVAADKMLGAARDARAKADTALGEARAIETEVGKSLPKALRAPGALEEAVAEAKAKLAALVEALETATVAAQTARESQAQAQTRVDETKKGLDTATERDAEAAKDWADALGKSGFEDDDDFQDARREDAEITVLDQEIRAWDEATARADERLKKAKKEAKGVVPPDLAPLDAAAKAASEEHAAGVEKLGGERNRVKTLEAILDQLREIEKDRAGDLSEQKIIGRLAQTADGKNGANMSFERFVLAAFLEDVLRAATGRLRKMSGGRYALHRATGGGDGRMKGGLDLDVLDAYTGRSRPVGTLSGGEGFEASLALALGMADVVQAQSGGIHLDAIFVDEGFGSLGSEDLDAVIGALEDLQEGGRLVGVISHVTELAERIPARLEVDKGRSGSSARFVVP